MFDMHIPDVEVFKEIPGYKLILKAVLKCQIQALVEQLSRQTGEESVLVTACPEDGTLTHLGSEVGKDFLGAHNEIKSKFLGFCFKRQHVQHKPQVSLSEDLTVRKKGPQTQTRRPRLAPYNTARSSRAANAINNKEDAQKLLLCQNTPENLQFYHENIKQEESRAENLNQNNNLDGSISRVKTEPIEDDDQMATCMPAASSDDGNQNMSHGAPPLYPIVTADGFPNGQAEKTEVQGDSLRSHIDVAVNDQTPTPGLYSSHQGTSLSNHPHEEFNPFDGQTTKLTTKTSTKSSYDGEKTERPQCPVCGKDFKNTRNLRFHMLTHSGVRPYACMFCWKRFSQKNVLDQHVLTHTGQKPYSCPTCGKCFAQRATLYRHEKGHKAALDQTNQSGDDRVERQSSENIEVKE